MNESRATRKLEHIKHAITTGQKRTHGLDDVQFVHNSLPNSSVEQVDLSTEIGELHLSSPIFINAMTGGGGEKTVEINKQLAKVAASCNLAVAVGSQMAAIKEPEQIPSYKVIREQHPNGIVIGNLGSEATVDQAKRAVDMIEANGIQIHLNTIQELVMPEGDRSFIDAIKRIEDIVLKVGVPVIVKEVGFGMSGDTAKQLADVGVSILDVGGFGGTNFSAIENERRQKKLEYFNDWGISTSSSIVEAKLSAPTLSVIGSGGLQNALDIVKAITLGASATGIAGYFLKIMMEEGIEALTTQIQEIHEDMKMIMTALGTTTIAKLQKAPIVINGDTHHWLEQRGLASKMMSERMK
ncbi:type 2 isopentenyl-diphosphate Delta-isomerase [Bacillus sp. FJAT-45350]|uniref:type 2 isopentenyl-diphosphate Delta-isomerase n=1 Tax=Bacillus sp. FJAT-45350 TaxID=2011014 RepID=UPI000BB68F98|nr:type 2 isopentenyl-diphosphate Delta-isomerase [Bacillus sp. FJAT-45350]